jgi:hypothetical protein
LSQAIRPLAAALSTGQTISLAFENGNIETGGAVGFGLQNAGGTNVLEFLFIGGQNNYTVTDSLGNRDTGLNWKNSGFPVSFHLTGGNTYLMQFGALNMTGSLINVSDQAITRLRFFNFNAGSGGASDFFFHSLRISAAGSSSVTSDTVAIVREIAALQDGIPVSWWQQYGLGSTNTAGGDYDHDAASNLDEYVADTNPTNPASYYNDEILQVSGYGAMQIMSGQPTSLNRVYDVWCSTSLVNAAWTALNLNVPGAADGSPVPLFFLTTTSNAFYRSGVKLP